MIINMLVIDFLIKVLFMWILVFNMEGLCLMGIMLFKMSMNLWFIVMI